MMQTEQHDIQMSKSEQRLIYNSGLSWRVVFYRSSVIILKGIKHGIYCKGD
jgi:hypothetical protein